jgi:hypothetical protein
MLRQSITIMTKTLQHMVGRRSLTLSNPSWNRACFQRVKPKCGEPLWNVAFKFNLRRYHMEKVSGDISSVSGDPATRQNLRHLIQCLSRLVDK